MKNTNNNRLIYTGALLAATLSFGQTAQAEDLILGGNRVVSTDTSVDGVMLGYGIDGNLTITSGATLSSIYGDIGYSEESSTGTAVVSDANSHWQNQYGVQVGFRGNGTLNIENGGKVTSNSISTVGKESGSIGTANVIGQDSLWQHSGDFRVGESGNGTLNIEEGGKVANTRGHIGYDSSSIGTVNVTGWGSVWENSDDLTLGFNGGSGTLNISDGGKVTDASGFIGYESGSTGVVTVTGWGSSWENSNGVSIGTAGTGTLNIENGGKVISDGGDIGFHTGSTGTVTVTGWDSSWESSNGIQIGGGGTGTLKIENGGTITSAHGRIDGLDGTVTVTGPGSSWQVEDRRPEPWADKGELYVGNFGTGTLNIENGGRVINDDTYIGNRFGSTGTVTVTGADSSWRSSVLYIGDYGGGTLNIENGGQVANYLSIISRSSGSTGTATVTGANSRWENSNALYVGNQGNGTLNIENSGKVTNTSGYIGVLSGSTGSVTVTGTGSRWENSGSLYVGGNASGAGGQGNLTINDGGIVSATNGVTIWSTGSLSGNGGTIEGDVINQGLIDPTEVFTITGDLALTETSILALDIFGPTMYDQLFIGGDFFIDGLLTLDFDGFTQSAFDTTYDLIHIGGDITGAWGDFDINVAGFDSALLGYSIVGSSVDGYSRALRLTIAGMGNTGGNPDDNTVPEPASILLIGLGGMALLFFRRRRQA